MNARKIRLGAFRLPSDHLSGRTLQKRFDVTAHRNAVLRRLLDQSRLDGRIQFENDRHYIILKRAAIGFWANLVQAQPPARIKSAPTKLRVHRVIWMSVKLNEI